MLLLNTVAGLFGPGSFWTGNRKCFEPRRCYTWVEFDCAGANPIQSNPRQSNSIQVGSLTTIQDTIIFITGTLNT